jgi:hypothetical protein
MTRSTSISTIFKAKGKSYYTLAYVNIRAGYGHNKVGFFLVKENGTKDQIGCTFSYDMYEKLMVSFQGTTDEKWDKTIAHLALLTDKEWEAIRLMEVVS